MAKSAKAVSSPILKKRREVPEFTPQEHLGVFEAVQWECKGSVVEHAVSCYIKNEFFEGTYVFDADEEYTPRGYKELGSVPEHDHAAAMQAAGFAIEEASDA